jgi:hypothetical protein
VDKLFTNLGFQRIRDRVPERSAQVPAVSPVIPEPWAAIALGL